MSHPLNLLIRRLESSARRSMSESRRRRPAGLDHSAETIAAMIGTLERHLSGVRSFVDDFDATLANGAFADPADMVAIDLADAETRLRALADEIERRRTALIAPTE
jgi:hypothetical protein